MEYFVGRYRRTVLGRDSSVNTKQVESFLAVAETLNFTEAARKLFYTQQTVSYQVAQLEKELGFALLERGPHGLALTPGGRQLQQDGANLLASMRDLAARARMAQEESGRIVRVRNSAYAYDPLFAQMLDAFAHESRGYAGVPLLPGYGPWEAAASQGPETFDILLDDVDALIVTDNHWESVPSWCSVAPLFPLVTHVVMVAGHPLATCGSVTIDDLLPYTVVTYKREVMDHVDLWHWNAIKARLDEFDVRYRSPSSYEESSLSVLGMSDVLLSPGAFVSLMPGLTQVPLVGGQQPWAVLAWRREPVREAVEAFAAFVLAYYRSHWDAILPANGAERPSCPMPALATAASVQSPASSAQSTI